MRLIFYQNHTFRKHWQNGLLARRGCQLWRWQLPVSWNRWRSPLLTLSVNSLNPDLMSHSSPSQSSHPFFFRPWLVAGREKFGGSAALKILKRPGLNLASIWDLDSIVWTESRASVGQAEQTWLGAGCCCKILTVYFLSYWSIFGVCGERRPPPSLILSSNTMYFRNTTVFNTLYSHYSSSCTQYFREFFSLCCI